MPDMPYDLERAVQQRAYEIWMQQGCPEGQAEAHWLQARAEVEDAIAHEQRQPDAAEGDPSSRSGITDARS